MADPIQHQPTDVTQRRRRRVRRSWSGRIRSVFAAAPAAPERLASDLEMAVRGEVRFDDGSRALYATDASNYRQVPVGVVIPTTVDDVVAAIAVARQHGVPVLPRGCGTSLAGQACNVALVIDFSKHLRQISSLDAERRLARVEPGCVLDVLRNAAAPYGLTFGPDPATHTHNTLGGMIGNNSGGVHSVMAGLTVDNIESLDILTYEGLRLEVGPTSEAELSSIIAAGGRRGNLYRRLVEFRDRYADLVRAKFPELPRRVSGYANLDWLLPERGFHLARALVGTEASLVTVLGATVRLVPNPAHRITVVLGFPDIYQAADAVPDVLKHQPLAIEGIDDKLIEKLRTKNLHTEKIGHLPEGGGWLVVEVGDDDVEAVREKARVLAAAFEKNGEIAAGILESDREQTELRLMREAALGATAWVPGQPETWEGWEDTAVPREALGEYLRDFRALLDKHGYDTAMYGHFGDGLVHCRINFELGSEAGLKKWRAFLKEAARLVARYGGSLSGEHGDGQARAELLEDMYGQELVRAFGEFKEIWDPGARMNPGKVVEPFPITSNLRVGPGYKPPPVKSHFSYPDDEGSFARATLRCVGVGKCRRPTTTAEGGVMCPSYMATGEEMHSTRGRARLLFEMLRDGPLEESWRSDAVEEALDLCLACKGCKSDCPVNVDMATYKAEFRARHYAGRLRPRAAYSMGHIYWWSRIGGTIPAIANLVSHTPGIATVAKWIGGISARRELPSYAKESYTRWFRRNRRNPVDGRKVILWPDTFNNFFTPHTLIAATKVLEAAGFAVTIPKRPLCCGRPLYDWGLLDRAKGLLRQTLETLKEEIDAGVPVIGLEPACVSAFREELPGLLPDEPRARRLEEQSYLFSEFMMDYAGDLAFAPRSARALVQLHCHHHAVLNSQAEWQLLERLGIEVTAHPQGCCGMAGGFGFEAEKHDVSVAVGETSLLPAVRAASPETLLLADGFSCREQIRQETGREARHIAEVVLERLNA